jgi:hypothetical protein
MRKWFSLEFIFEFFYFNVEYGFVPTFYLMFHFYKRVVAIEPTTFAPNNPTIIRVKSVIRYIKTSKEPIKNEIFRDINVDIKPKNPSDDRDTPIINISIRAITIHI